MRKVNFGSDELRKDIPVTFNNFQGMNIVDNDTNLPKHQVPYALNVDFSRVIGAGAKRHGLNSLFTSLGTGGSTGFHTYRKSSGDIPLYGFSTAVYKLTGTQDTVAKTTDADFEAGTLTNVVTDNDTVRNDYGGSLPLLFDSQEIANYTSLTLGTSVTTIGQSITIPSQGVEKIHSIVGTFKYWGAGSNVTLTLYDDVNKSNVLGSVTEYGPKSAGDFYMESVFAFAEPVTVTPDSVIYYEYTVDAGALVVGYAVNAGTDGRCVYVNGVASTNHALYFKIYKAYNTYKTSGTYESEVIDIGITPTTSAITINDTVSTYAPTPETAPTASATGSGSLSGTYKYKIAFIDHLGLYGKPSVDASAVASSNAQIDLSDIPTYTGCNRAIFRTKAGGSTFYYLATISDDTTTTHNDTTPDLSLTVEMVAPNTPNTSMAYYVKGSIDNQYWGDWISVVTGDAVPLTRYLKFKAVFTGTTTGSPILENYTITFTGAYDTATSIISGLSGNRVRYVNWNDRCYFVDGVRALSYDGTTVNSVTSANPPPASTIIFEKNNYFFYVATADPTRLYVSNVNLPNTVFSNSYFQLPGPILGIASYFNHLIVTGKDFTVDYVGTIFNPDPSVGDWKRKNIDNIGCESHEAMVNCIDGKTGTAILIMPTKDGIRYLYPDTQEYSLQADSLSRDVQPYFDQAILKERMTAIFYDQSYYIAFNWSDPTGQVAGYNNAVMKLDLRNREWSGKWDINCSGFAESGGKLYIADSQVGKVHEHTGFSDNGEAIDMILDSSFVGNHEKRRYKKVIIDVKRGSDTTNSQIITRVDDSEGTINVGACTNWAGASLSSRDAQDAIKSPQKNIPSSRGYNFGFRFRDDSTNDVVLYGITVLAEPN